MLGRFGRIVAIAAVSGLALLAAMVDPPEASAYTEVPRTVLLNPSNWGGTYNLVEGTTAFTGSSSAELAVGRAALVAGTAPAVGTIGTLALGAGALSLGVAIGTGLDRMFDISCSISSTCGDTTDRTSGSYSAEQTHWTYYPTGQGGWVGSEASECASGNPCYLLRVNLIGVAAADTWSGIHGSGAMPAIEAAMTTGVSVGTYHHGNFGCGNPDCAFRSATVAQIEAMLDRSPVRPRTSEPYDVGLTGFTPASEPAYNSSMAEDIADALEAEGVDAAVEIAQEVDPAYEGLPPEEFTMPDCEGLTYAACLALLEAEGYVGSITTNELGIDDAVLALGGSNVVTTNPAAGVGAVGVEDDVTFNVNPDPLPLEVQAQLANETAVEYLARIGFDGEVTYVELPTDTSDPELGPSAPVRIVAPAPSSGTRSITVPYPEGDTPAERIPNEETTEITVYTNSPDMPLIPPGGIGGCEPWLEAEPDFGPVTDIDYGNKFPFGIFVWADELLDTLTTSPTAPGWEHSVPALDGRTVPAYEWDLSFFDDYMGIWRTLLSFALWVGAIWYLATSILGFRSAGDPAEAIDDVL